MDSNPVTLNAISTQVDEVPALLEKLTEIINMTENAVLIIRKVKLYYFIFS